MRRSAAVTMLVAALAAGGCGGGGGDDKTVATTPVSTGPLTKAQFIAAADKVCKATSAKIDAAAANIRAAARKTGTIPTSQVSRFMTQTSLPAYDAMLDDLRALTPPKEDEKTIDRLIASLAGAIDTAKADPVRLARNPSIDPFDDANARAMKYGMKVCGSTTQ